MDNLVLTFDVGTQSTRAAIVNKIGKIEAFSQIIHEKPFLNEQFYGQAEQHPDYYYQKICQAVSELKHKDTEGNKFSRIKAVVMATFRDSIVLLDKNNKPLDNAILWMDERKASTELKLPKWKKLIFKLVGMTEAIKMNYKTTRYNWYQKNRPEILEKTAKYVLLSSYLNYKLTGNLKDSVACQVGHIPFNGKERKWQKKSISKCVFDIPEKLLVDLVETGQEIGKINTETSNLTGIAKGIPLYASGTDKACETLGLSVIGKNKAAISLGTAATIQFCTNKYFSPKPFLPSYPSIIPEYYNIETQVYRGYWTVTWFKENFCDYEKILAKQNSCTVENILDSYLDEISPGCNGLIMTPHLAPGIGNPYAKGIISGITDKHTKKHLYRAIVEGINFELLHSMKEMEKRGNVKIEEIYISGGGSRCNSILQITSDMFGLPVKRIQTPETTSIGCAIIGFCAIGEYTTFNQAIQSMCHDTDIFTPNQKNHQLYSQIYKKVYTNLEKNNTQAFKNMHSLFNYM